ncbi:SPAS2 protein, partial [Daphoenositta chrysoptera]|nr:SPAS2 protein [Daphoenositta chrysoptera]
PADSSGFIFDVQSGAVRAQGGSSENMKEKIGAVRAVVPNRSNTEIVLVLQHFDNCVARPVQAFMEGNASEVLKEWTVTGKKKHKKKKPKPPAPPGPVPVPVPGGRSQQEQRDGDQRDQRDQDRDQRDEDEEEQRWEAPGGALNGCQSSPCRSLESLSDGPEPPGTALGNGIPAFSTQNLPAAPAQSLRSEPGSPAGKKTGKTQKTGSKAWGSQAGFGCSGIGCPLRFWGAGCGLEKSLKDLQRCSVALARFRALLREELHSSGRRMKLAFADIHACLMDREVSLLAEMDQAKAEAMEILAFRQRRAEALRQLTEAAPGMSEEQLLELRADIKHFVSERKFDEELGRAGRFGCDLEALRGSIRNFGQVSHPRTSYSSRSRCSSSPAGIPTPNPAGSQPGLEPGSPPEPPPAFPGSPPGSSPAFPGSSSGSFPGSPPDSAAPTEPGPAPAPQPGLEPGSPPEPPPAFPGSPPGSSPAFPGSSSGSFPGSPPDSAAPTEPGPA